TVHRKPATAAAVTQSSDRRSATASSTQRTAATAAPASMTPTPPTGNTGPTLPSGRQHHLGSAHHQVATERHVDRVGEAADGAAAEVELGHVDQHHLEAPLLEPGADPGGAGGHHHGRADHDG